MSLCFFSELGAEVTRMAVALSPPPMETRALSTSRRNWSSWKCPARTKTNNSSCTQSDDYIAFSEREDKQTVRELIKENLKRR